MRKFLSVLFAFIIIATSTAIPFVAYAEEGQPAITVVGSPATIVVYRKSNILGVYDKNWQLIKACFVSTGKPGHETPLGTYTIYQHTDNGDYHPMVDGTFARYCMRFKKGGFMFHSVCYANRGDPEPILQEVADIGTSVSLGCVRLYVDDAKWLYTNISDGCQVVVLDY